jgi:hypothetical protein
MFRVALMKPMANNVPFEYIAPCKQYSYYLATEGVYAHCKKRDTPPSRMTHRDHQFTTPPLSLHLAIGVQTTHGPATRPTARPFGTAHGRHGTAGSVPVPARHEGPCGSWAAGLAHDTALARHDRHGGMVPARPHLASSPRIPTTRSHLLRLRPHLLRVRPHLLRLASSPSTAARRARTRAPWPMGGTGGTARVNGPCVVSWAEGLAHSTVWHGTVGTVARRGTSPCRAGTARPCRVSCRHGTVATYTPGTP